MSTTEIIITWIVGGGFSLILIGSIVGRGVSEYKDKNWNSLKTLRRRKFHSESYLQFIEKVKEQGLTYRIVDVKDKGFKVQILLDGVYEDFHIPYFNSFPWASRHYVKYRTILYRESEHYIKLYLESFKKAISDEFPIVKVGRHIMCPYVYVWRSGGSGQTSWDVCYVDPNSFRSVGEGHHYSEKYDVEVSKTRAKEHLEFYLEEEAKAEERENRPKEIIINQ